MRVDQPPATAGQGLVATNFARGSIILGGPKGDVTVRWNGKVEDRALPPGTYRVRTTRVEREKDGMHWFVSSTSPPGRPVVVKAGATARIDVDDTVHFRPRAVRKGGRLQLGFAIMGADRRGLSIYRNDKRVPVTYKVLSREGKVLASGTMNYG